MDEFEKIIPDPPRSGVPAEARQADASGAPSGRRDPAGPTIDDPNGPSGAETRIDGHHNPRASGPGPDAPTIDGGADPGTSPRALPVLPGYEILGELGRGGMGVVFKATHLRLHRLCALKMVRSGPLASSEALVRFLAEAESVARLRHPHIVTIHHIGEHDGLPFIELEYLTGGSLDERLDGTPLAPRHAAGLVATLADAVQAAHEAGVVHRDLKPANVLLDDHESPKVADFGVAKAIGSDSGLTATDSILGSPSYMAPEQAGGHSREVGPAADIYALGAILYELLTGRPPFRGATLLETLEQVKNAEPVPPSRLVPGLPRDLETIALTCLRKEPERRYHSAASLEADLRRFLAGEPIVARPVSSWERLVKWGRRRPAIAALLALLTMAIVAGFVGVSSQWLRAEWQKESLRRQNYIARVNLALSECLGNDVARALQLLDGCPVDLRGWEWAYVWRQCHLDLKTFREPGPAVNAVAFSPDGRQVACGSGHFYDKEPGVAGALVIRDATTGRVVFERDGLTGGVRSVAFSPDGRWIAASFGPHLAVWELATGRERFPPRTEPGERSALGLAFSPDGKRIVLGFGILGNFETPGYARLLDASNGEAVGGVLPGRECGVWSVAFSPDGRQVALTSKGLVEVWDVEEVETPRRIHSLPVHGGKLVYAVAFSPDGRRLASGGLDKTVQLWDRSTGAPVRSFHGHEGFVRALAFSPDGRRLASGAEDKVVKLWEVDSGRGLATFRGHAHFVLGVAFSPDGSRVASGGLDRLVKLWFATPSLDLTFDRHDGWVSIAISPEGQLAASTASFLPYKESWTVLWDRATGEPIRSFPAPTEAWPLAFSPDGRRLATGERSGMVTIWEIATGRRLLEFEAHDGGTPALAFSPDGRRLASAGYADRTVKIWDAQTGRLLFSPLAFEGQRADFTFFPGLAFSPDAEGRYLAATDSDSTVKVWDTRTGRLAYAPLEHRFPVHGVAFHSEGRLLVSTGGRVLEGRAEVTVWDPESGRKIADLLGHTDVVRAVAISPDGRRLATGSDDRTIKLWDTETFEEVFTLRGHTSGVISLSFSPDGRRLVSGSIDQTARIWDLDRPSLATLYRREAVSLVWPLFDRHRDTAAVLEALRSDPSLREPMRGMALDVAEGWPIGPDALPVGIRPDPAR
ncbi:protein kinase domain-containing protein [Tautonia plasticadhaerens]|uniref:non-specific serine/threonine protein kinase n=1 Tax=Tautonia plasticadhaerens TaxID=2527974 RepID=A0A518H059_9BACT|nr:serine/threonine-protein kinase [Tautonia plasticadhaerens]QDV34227.1 Serine/threonine-protein kinase PknB [Tautonia plasticadhaerens]